MHTPAHWIAFNLFVLIAVALDLAVFRRRVHKVSLREALLWSVVWLLLATAFGLAIWHFNGRQSALEYFTGYVIEKALSADNLFVFLVIFRVFAVKEEYQHRVLAYGILGALLLRGAMIAAGAALLSRFDWISYLFGAFIIYAAVHLMVRRGAQQPQNNFLVRYLATHLRLTSEFRNEKFFVRESGKLFATPLFLALLVVEVMDVAFAVDSIPAVFGITRDPFIVYSSNVFAVLGLRSLYFLLAGVLDRLAYLDIGLGLMLIFVGGKMIAERWLHISVGVSLAVVTGLLFITIVASLLAKRKSRRWSNEELEARGEHHHG